VAGRSDLGAFARDRVAGPAIALIVTAGLGLALQIIALPINLLSATGAMPGPQGPMGPGGPGAPPEVFISGGFSVVAGLITIGIGILIIVGALKMKNLQSRAWGMTAAILAMIPCTSPCCLLGLPFGIWALVVLSDADVQMAFEQEAGRPPSAPPGGWN
jgi:hypothetical protein